MSDDYKRIRVLSADHLNLARGKYAPASIAARGHLNACVGIYAVDYKRDLIPAEQVSEELIFLATVIMRMLDSLPSRLECDCVLDAAALDRVNRMVDAVRADLAKTL